MEQIYFNTKKSYILLQQGCGCGEKVIGKLGTAINSGKIAALKFGKLTKRICIDKTDKVCGSINDLVTTIYKMYKEIICYINLMDKLRNDLSRLDQNKKMTTIGIKRVLFIFKQENPNVKIRDIVKYVAERMILTLDLFDKFESILDKNLINTPDIHKDDKLLVLLFEQISQIFMVCTDWYKKFVESDQYHNNQYTSLITHYSLTLSKDVLKKLDIIEAPCAVVADIHTFIIQYLAKLFPAMFDIIKIKEASGNVKEELTKRIMKCQDYMEKNNKLTSKTMPLTFDSTLIIDPIKQLDCNKNLDRYTCDNQICQENHHQSKCCNFVNNICEVCSE